MKRLTQFIRASVRLQSLVLLSLFPSLILLPSNLQANPTGGIVTGGAAEIGEGLGGHLQINQASSRAVIDWASFSIAAGELTQFIQPGADAAVLNRVISGTPTAIMGALQANGNVAVINTAGILVGPSGTIDVNGLLLSSLDVNNADFMGGGDMLFRGAGAAGVTNMGRINAVGGDVFLVGKTVVNSGTISAANGTVGLAAGEEVLITAAPDAAGERVFVRPTAGVASGTGVDNSGSIEGAMVELKAHGNMYALAINNSGSIRATGASNRGGKVTLRAIGGTITNSGSIAATLPNGTGGRIILDAGVGGTVNAGGTIDASATGDGKIGGVVMISGESVTVPGGANISANGEGGGGFIQIGSGDGVDAQNVAVEAGSSISANGGSGPGGMVVIQGGTDSNVMVAGAVSATSQSGDGGIIVVEGGDVSVTSTSTLDASGANGGVITVTGENSAVVNGSLNAVGSAGNGGVINISGGNSTTVGSTANINAGGSVNGGMVTITGGGTTTVAGTVNSIGGAGKGGQIQALGAAVEMAASARVDASGLAGGGQVNIGGGFQGKNLEIINATTTTVAAGARIAADATGDGDGGTVVVWADGDTLYEGSISVRGAGVGNGGFVEVSGKDRLVFEGEVDTMAADGSAGTLLLDPGDINIGGAVQTALGSSNVWVVTGNAGAGNGDIITNGQIRWNNANSLSLLAWGDVDVNYNIQNAGQGSVNIVAGWDGSTGLVAPAVAGSGQINMTGPVDMSLFFGSSGTYGQRDGSVVIGAQRDVAVGSRFGDTNIVGYDINMQTGTSSSDWVQIGFRDDGQTNWWTGTTNGTGTGTDLPGNGATGNITLEVHNELRGEVNGGAYSVVQIGHGGVNASYQAGLGNIGDASGNITITTGVDGLGTGNVTMSGANSNQYRAWVQIGHGGWRNRGNHSGDITIDTTAGTVGDVYFESGDEYRNYSQIGHGGHEFNSDGYGGGYNMSGNIDVQAGGKVTFLAAKGTGVAYNSWRDAERAFTQLGHGGFEVDGTHTGDIAVNAGGDILFQSGDQRSAYAQLGHGGYSSGTNLGGTNGGGVGNHSGTIDVDSGGSITFDARGRMTDPGLWTAVKTKYNAYVQLGHGGYGTKSGSDGAPQGFTGDIFVDAEDGISFIAGTMPTVNDEDGRLYAQLGHGGWDADASGSNTNYYADPNWGHSGDIQVTSRNGNISFTAGNADDPAYAAGHAGTGRFHFAQLGHGGYASGGNHHGDITVVAENGGISVIGGKSTDNSADRYNYAKIGHGGDNDQGHQGRSDEKITVHALGVGNDVSVIAGKHQYAYAQIGNGGRNVDGTHLGDVEVYAGGDVILRGGIADDRVVSRIGEYQDISGTNGGNGNDLSEFNAYWGSGGLGYLLMDQAAAAGGGQKTKLIGENIEPGTVEFRLQTNVYNGAVAANYVDDGAGNIIPFGGGAAVGTINYTTGEIVWNTAILGSDTANQPDIFVNYDHLTGIRNDAIRAYAQIGHGGYESRSVAGAHPEGAGVNLGHTGDIDVRAGVDAMGAYNNGGGSISAIAGNDQRTYVRIGHGGDDAIAPTGHAYRGDITVKADGSIDFRGGGGLVDNQNIAFNFGGDGNIESVTQGRSNSGISDIVYAFAQIGHGGHNSDANGGLDNNSNDPLAAITDTTGHSGDILVETNTGDIDFTGGGVRGYGHFAQIGHGGHSTHGNHHGDIAVNSGADINFTAGGTAYRSSSVEKRSYAMIGHGGHGMAGNLEGDIDVDAGGKITFSGGNVDSNFDAVPWGAHVYVMNRAGNQDENHSNRTEARQNVAQIGHGGTHVYGDKQGDITVSAGTGISFNGGLRLDQRDDSARENFAMIGHGGIYAYRHFRNNISPAGVDPHINRADDFNVFSNLDGTGLPFWPIDNAGNYLPDGFEGDIAVTSTTGDIAFTGGNAHRTFAMVGHGGYYTPGDHKGDISVNAIAGDIIFNADVDNHGVNAGQNGSGNNTFTQIGHGGSYSDGDIGAGGGYTTDIDVNAGGAIRFDAGDSSSYSMVGHGGRSAIGTSATTWTTPDFRHGGDANYAYRPGSRSGDINVDAVGDILFTGGNTDGDVAFVQIGHGGYQIAANPDASSAYGDGHSGDINVTSTGGGITFQAGNRLYDFAQIGHGGSYSFGNHGGDGGDNRLDSDILVESSGDIAFHGGTRTNSNADARAQAMIGHGGYMSSFRDVQDYTSAHYAIIAPYNNSFPADNGGAHPWAPFTTNPDGLAMQLGTGNLLGTVGVVGPGAATLGTFKGDITVRTTGDGDIKFHAANDADGTLIRNADESFVQIGHGGYRNYADIEGNIVVESAGGIEFHAVQGTGDGNNSNSQAAYALLGHGGYESGGDFNGDITVTAVNTIQFKGGDSDDGAGGSFAQLGHGGYNSDDDHGQYKDAAKDGAGAQPATTGGSTADPGNSGNISVTVTAGDLIFLAGRDSQTYAQLGHGGYSTRDSHSGDITVTVSGGIAFVASIDHTVPVGANPGGNSDAYAMLGHGGHDADGSHSGDITIRAGEFAGGSLLPDGRDVSGYGFYGRAGDYDDTSVKLGHGGAHSRSYGTGATAVGISGDIDLEVLGDIAFIAGTYSNAALFTNEDGRAYAQLGHGGYDSDVSYDGATVTGLVDGSGDPIGHSGDIRVVANDGGIYFLGGDINRAFETSVGTGRGNYHYAQIGHGGANSHGNHYGNIEVRAGIAADGTVGASADGDILFASGGSTDNEWADTGMYAQLGHGGRSSQGNIGLRDGSGNALDTFTVMAGRDLTFTAEDGGPTGYVMLGNGGWAARGDHAANINVFAERNVKLAGGDRFTGVPALGAGQKVNYGFGGSDTSSWNNTINQDYAANMGGGADFNTNWTRVVPGTLSIAIRLDNGTIVGNLSDSDGNGTLTADADITANFQDGLGTRTITAGTVVANVTYSVEGTSKITFLQDVNPGVNGPNSTGFNEGPGDAGTVNLWVSFETGDHDITWAQIGNGGGESDNANNVVDNGHRGNISVVARTGDILLEGGTDDISYAQVGNGGYATKGNNSGDIHVRAAGNVSLVAGLDRAQNHAQIGHGGYDGDGSQSGVIKVSAGSGDLFTSLGLGIFDDLGDFNWNSTADLIQFAPGGAGNILLQGGNSENYAQIGHGGRSAMDGATTLDGDIGVSATGDIDLLAGAGSRSYAQIGHGGWHENQSADITGDISVITEGGDLTLKARGWNTYAVIGHGGDDNDKTTRLAGSREGGIFVLADRITIDRNGDRVAWIGHLFDMANNVADPFANNALANPADNLGGGYQVIARSGMNLRNNGSTTLSNTFTITDYMRDLLITPNIGDGPVSISGGNIVVNSILDDTTIWANPADRVNGLNLIAGGDIDVNRRITNSGAGDVNLIAGANLAANSVIDSPSIGGADYQRIDHLYCPPIGYLNMAGVKVDGAQFGNDNGYTLTSAGFFNAAGEVSVDATNNGGYFRLAVGSKTGATNVLAYGVQVIGGNSTDEYAQVGFNTDAAADPATGDVMIEAKEGGVLIQGGAAGGSFAQVGHGGTGGNVNSKDLSGMISVRADRGVGVGDVSVLSGTGDRANAQIGHGGRRNDGNHSGEIVVIGNALTVTSDKGYAQIGHGGFQVTGSLGGDVFINFDPSANMGAGAAIGGGGALSITSGNGFDDYAQIGHGGVVAGGGTRSGNITVGDSASVAIQGGSNKSSYAQLGHGGVSNGGGAISGNIDLTTQGNLTLQGGSGGQQFTYAQIGHGGSNHSGTKIGNIGITANGALVSLTGGTGSVSGMYAQIGHGGYSSGNTAGGTIDLAAPNAALTLAAGTTGRSQAMIGHGGWIAKGAHTGNIDVQVGGDIALTGSGTDSFAQVGHGGFDADGNSDGTIKLLSSAGGLTMTGGGSDNSYTQIGHGGNLNSGNHGASIASGEIEVGVATAVTLNSNVGSHSRSQIGNGGIFALGNHAGDICVHAGGAIVLNSGANVGLESYTQIGNGGRGAAGNHSGKVVVTSGLTTTGGVSLIGGSLDNQYAQIGHGGHQASGNHSGSIFVIADNGGDFNLTGGTGYGTYAMVGHGDGMGVYGNPTSGSTSGTRQGGMQYFVDGNSNFTAGIGISSNVYIHHRTNSPPGLFNDGNPATLTDTYLGGDGYQYVVNGTTNDVNTAGGAFEGQSSMVNGNLGLGDVVITNTGDLTLSGTNQFVNNAFDFIVLTTGNLNMEYSYQNAGSGDLALVAGWDGSTELASVDLTFVCAPEIIPGAIDFNDHDAWGLNNGVLTVGSSTQTSSVAFGSRQGDTILRGYGIDVLASDTTAGAYTQIGFRTDGTGDATGVIDIRAKQGGLALTGGAANNASVQIGHGGSGATNDIINAPITISFCVAQSGDVTLNAGAGSQSHAQIGHGIRGANGNRFGNIDIANFSSLTLNGGGTESFAQIGHGGFEGDGTKTGNITLTGAGVIGQQGDVSLQAGTGGHAYTQIGHGGRSANGNMTGNISLTNVVDYTANGGAGDSTNAHLGHGGREAPGTLQGDITLAASGAIRLAGSTGQLSDAQIGHGGYNTDGTKSGHINVTAGGLISMASGDGNIAYTQIGHGGRAADGDSLNSNITVASGAAITATGGSSDTGWGSRYTQIGHGGEVARGNHSGTIQVDAVGDINFNAGSRERDYAQIGHGGIDSDKTNGNATAINFNSGNITVRSTAGGIGFAGSTTATASGWQYAQLGHGGGSVSGVSVGDVTVDAQGGDIVFQAGNRGTSYTQLGHGGRDSRGNRNGIIDVDSSGDISFTGGRGTYDYALLGHGGTGAKGDQIGNIFVTSNGANGIHFQSGSGAQTWTQLGHGGWDADGTGNSGNIQVTANSGGDIIFDARSFDPADQDSNNSYTQLGHGGRATNGSHFGTIDVTTVGGGDINFTGGDYRAFAQLGHGGRDSSGNQGDDGTRDAAVSAISVNSSGAVNFTANGGAAQGWDGRDAYVQLGHGGLGARGDHVGNITVTGTSVNFIGSNDNYRGYAQIGNGGFDADNPNPGLFGYGGGGANTRMPTAAERIGNLGDIVVTSTSGDIQFISGNRNDTYTQIGHGGYGTDGDHAGSIIVTSAGKLVFDAVGDRLNPGAGGRDGSHYSQIGHGGRVASGSMTGSITVNAVGQIDFYGGPSASYAQIGHGGANSHDTSVTASDPNNGTPRYYDRRGGGNDRYYPGTHKGDIAVDAGGDINFKGYNFYTYNRGGSTGYVQLGHGGYQNDADPNSVNGTGHNGKIDVTAGGGITFETGQRVWYSYAQLGHGGALSFGNHGDDGTGNTAVSAITVKAGNGINFVAHGGDDVNNNWGQRGGRNYAMLGNGGWDTDYKVNANYATLQWFGAENDPGNVNGSIPTPYSATDDSGFHPLTPGISATESKTPINLVTGPIGSIGNISVSTTSGDIRFIAPDGTAGGGLEDRARESFVQLGNGGWGATGNHKGDINVDSAGSITFQAGLATKQGGGDDSLTSVSYAQLGHGGRSASGNHSGTIDVRTRNGGGITFSSGVRDSYAQLGHGGRDARGNLGDSGVLLGSGDLDTLASKITVISAGNIAFGSYQGLNQWGESARSYVQLGHGGYGARGDHVGDIDVRAVGDILFTGGTGMESYAQLGNGGHESDNPNGGVDRGHIGKIDVTTTGGGDIIFTAGGNGQNGRRSYAQLGHGGFSVSGHLGEDPNRPGDVTVSAITVNSSGKIIFQAGQGSSGGSDLEGYESYAMLGHGGQGSRGDHLGNIEVLAEGDILFKGGTEASSTRNSVLIGHGGWDADDPNGNTTLGYRGDISVASRTGEVALVGGAGSDSSVLIGHGERSTSGTNTGNIVVRAAQDVRLVAGTGLRSFAQIGHGGWDSDGAHSGLVTVSAGTGLLPSGLGLGRFNDIGGFGTIQFGVPAGGFGKVQLLGGLGSNESWAKIGHGGQSTNGNHNGNINVASWDDIVLTGGTGSNNNAQIGHGGRSASGNQSGDIAVVSHNGSILATGGSGTLSSVKIGHGGDEAGGTKSGLITVEAMGGNIEFRAGSRDRAFAQLGHGALNGAGAASGDITVTASGNVLFASGGGSNNWKFAQLGHGGYNSDGSHSGDIKVVAGGNIDFDSTAATGGAGFTQLGHGGERADGSHSGAVSARAGGTITFAGGGSSDAYSQFGHGGRTARGDHSGRLEMLANGTISFTAGGGDRAYAQFGHGGHDADLGNSSTVGNVGDLSLASMTGGISFSGGGGTDAYAQLGHGGALTEGANSGNIVARSGGDFLVTPGSGTGAYAQVGHGGTSASGDAGHTGSITVTAGTFDPDLQFVGIVANRVYQDVFDVDMDGVIEFNGDDDVLITNNTTAGLRVGALTAGGTAGSGAYSQIGHGGRNAHGNHGAGGPVVNEIYIESTGALRVHGGSAADSSAQIGHGGQNVVGNLNGRIITASEGDTIVQGGSGDRGYAQIGLGGHDDVAGLANLEGDKDGKIVVYTRNGDIGVHYNSGTGAYGQIGHGGLNNDGNFSHEGIGLYVFAGSEGAMTGGNLAVGDTVPASLTAGTDAYGMIGSGDGIPRGEGDRSDTVLIGAANNMVVEAGALGVQGHRTANGSLLNAYTFINTGGDYTIGTPGDVNGFNANNQASGGLAIASGGTITVNEPIVFSSAYDLTFAAVNNIILNSSIQNEGSTNVNLVAGWDGMTGLVGPSAFTFANCPPATPGGLSFAPIQADVNSYGNGDGVTRGLVRIGDGTQTDSIAVGSRNGATNVFGHTLDVNAGVGLGDFVQIGFHTDAATNTTTGNITAAMKGDITMDAGAQNGAYVQVGHGASYVLGGGSLGGTISVTTTTGGVSVTGGGATDTYGQIGHGGVNNVSDKGGSILVRADGGDVILTAGTGEKSYTQIGHGGVNSGASTMLGNGGELIEVIAGNDVSLRGSDGGLRAYAQIGNGGFNSDAAMMAGDVRVLASNDLNVTGGAAQQGFAQIGHGGGASDGDKAGTIIVDAGDGLLTGNITLTRGAGNDAFAKIGHGDQMFTSGAAGSASGTIDGGIQVAAGESLTSLGGMIGHVDDSLGGSAVVNSGSTFVAVSRNDFEAPPFLLMSMAIGDGMITADSASVFSSASGGELRFYLPRRDSNQIDAGALLNGVSYAGGQSDPALQRSDEFSAAFGEHTNLNTEDANELALVLNLDPIDAASYSTALGNYSFYFDNINVNVPPPVVLPEAPAAPPAPPVPPIFVSIDGQLNFNQGVFGPGAPFVPVGPFVEGLTNDYFNSDAQRNDLVIFDVGDKNGWTDGIGPWTSSFEILFPTVEGAPGWSSYTVYGDPSFTVGTYGFGFDGLNNAPEMDDELRRMLENLEAELAELRGGE